MPARAVEPPAPGEENQVLDLFRILDTNGDGSIDREELSYILYMLDSAVWSSKKLDRLFKIADVNRDGKIDYREFCSWVFGFGREQKEVRTSLRERSATAPDYLVEE